MSYRLQIKEALELADDPTMKLSVIGLRADKEIEQLKKERTDNVIEIMRKICCIDSLPLSISDVKNIQEVVESVLIKEGK